MTTPAAPLCRCGHEAAVQSCRSCGCIYHWPAPPSVEREAKPHTHEVTRGGVLAGELYCSSPECITTAEPAGGQERRCDDCGKAEGHGPRCPTGALMLPEPAPASVGCDRCEDMLVCCCEYEGGVFVAPCAAHRKAIDAAYQRGLEPGPNDTLALIRGVNKVVEAAYQRGLEAGRAEARKAAWEWHSKDCPQCDDQPYAACRVGTYLHRALTPEPPSPTEKEE